MKRTGMVFVGVMAGVLLAALCRRGLWPQRPDAWDRWGNVLRDALRDAPTKNLAQRHAVLASKGESACSLCHGSHRNIVIQAAWGGNFPKHVEDVAVQAGMEPYRADPEVAAAPSGEPEALSYGVPASAVCLSCHDGTLDKGSKAFGNHGGNHPIGIDYRIAMMKNPSDYNTPDENRGIRLEAGRIGCVSCHRMHARSADISSMGVSHASCQTCHRL